MFVLLQATEIRTTFLFTFFCLIRLCFQIKKYFFVLNSTNYLKVTVQKIENSRIEHEKVNKSVKPDVTNVTPDLILAVYFELQCRRIDLKIFFVTNHSSITTITYIQCGFCI